MEAYYDDEIDLMEYLKVIWKYKWFIAAGAIIAVLITFFVTKAQTPMYSSTVSVIIPQEESGGSNIAGMLGGLGFGGMIAGNSNSELIIEVMKSRRMREEIVSRLNLVDHYDLREIKPGSFEDIFKEKSKISKLINNLKIMVILMKIIISSIS